MGDQIGVAVSGTLYYVPYKEFQRILSLSIGPIDRTALFAALCRINTLYMISRAGSGHIGSSFSSMEIMSWLQINELRGFLSRDSNNLNDIFFSSKGHDAPALYSTWIGLGKLNFDLVHKLRRIDGLPGHPDVSTPNVLTNTGSLGMGVSKAKGIIFANRLQNKLINVFVLTGDGELQEGQFWESLISAANHKLQELTVIVDNNKLQSDTYVTRVSDLGDLEAKLKAFGWHVSRCDGNNLKDFSKTLMASKNVTDKPKIIIADTVKGRGVSFMEHTSIDSDVEFYNFHSGAPTDDAYVKAAQELIDSANSKLAAIKEQPLEVESIDRPVTIQQKNSQRLIQAYSNALIEQAKNNAKIIALDADLVLDTGLIPFQKQFPDRFIECGIAEQDMVSQAGGIATQGLLPIVHSFSCFLSSRPNEQIYNNASERGKVIYVGSLAGILPGGPGHSHQAVRDISSLGSIPGLTLIEPSCESEVGMLLNWAINTNQASSYLRLVSIPLVLPYSLPSDYKPELGKGVTLKNGNNLAIISYGPVMLSLAISVSQVFKEKYDVDIKVINLPWLNFINSEWLISEVSSCKTLISIENHYGIGGQGDRIANVLAATPILNLKMHKIALEDFPVCGTNQEVLDFHGFSVKNLTSQIIDFHFNK
jgi:transketolase